MSDAPHIFTLPSASWSDRTSGPATDLAAQHAVRSRQRIWIVVAAACSWVFFALLATLVWLAS